MATEKKLIDVSQAINKMQACIDESGAQNDSFAVMVFGAFMDALKQEPAVDAVEVVRCKDCKYAGINENHPKKPLLCYMTRMCGRVNPNWYCWQGERKGNVKRNEN